MLAIADLKREDANVKYRLVRPAVVITVVAAVVLTPFKHAVAQSGTDTAGKNANQWCIGCSVDGKTTPRTADGHPNLSGFWINPESGHIASLSPDGSKLFDFAGEETAGQRGALLKVCLEESCQAPNQPPYKPEYAAKVNAIYATAYGGNTPLDPQMDCKPLGVPRGAVGTMQIVQSPEAVAILYEGQPGMAYRLIYTDGRPHPKDLDTSYLGDSIGHWQKDTLVVDVSGLNDETWLGGGQLGFLKHTAIHSDQEHVVERWTRDGDVLTYEATVEDPVMFTRPWVVNPRHIRHATSADDYIMPEFCTAQDKDHIIKPTATDQYKCVYCLTDEPDKK
jgi:hypothetical protein